MGIDYEVRMERTAQPWAAVELLGPPSLTTIVSGRHLQCVRH